MQYYLKMLFRDIKDTLKGKSIINIISNIPLPIVFNTYQHNTTKQKVYLQTRFA